MFADYRSEVSAPRRAPTLIPAGEELHYFAMQLSKPSLIILPGRLRPMKTIRLSRFSSVFHGR
jgi:hypothetical protein